MNGTCSVRQSLPRRPACRWKNGHFNLFSSLTKSISISASQQNGRHFNGQCLFLVFRPAEINAPAFSCNDSTTLTLLLHPSDNSNNCAAEQKRRLKVQPILGLLIEQLRQLRAYHTVYRKQRKKLIY